MIDIEKVVFTQIANAIEENYPNATVVSEHLGTVSSFPCVEIVEENNSTYVRSLDNDLTEHHANLLYSVNVYSNKVSGAKTEARNILEIVDRELQAMKFIRSFMQPIPNADRSIYRLTARYTAIVGKGITEGDTTTHQMYRE